jgi:serine protease Do
MTSSEVDGYLTLYDAGGNVVRRDDNSYGSNDPLIVQYLPAGTYKLAARAASSTVGGLYEIDLRTVTGPRPPFATPKATIAAGDTVTGVITYTACQYADNTFADVYQINLPADTTIDLRLNSSEFDAYLILLDSKGAVIDQDDNSGGNTNARITRSLAAGTYYIIAKPIGDYTSHGAYTLTTTTAN